MKEVQAGEIHQGSLSYDGPKVWRVFAKIGLGLLFAGYPASNKSPAFEECRRFVIGERNDSWKEFVMEVQPPGTLEHWPEQHVAVVHAGRNGVEAIISLFGSCHVVRLSATSSFGVARPLVALAGQNSGKTRLLDDVEAPDFIEKLVCAASL